MKKLFLMAVVALTAMAASAQQAMSPFPKVDAFLSKNDFQSAIDYLNENVDKVNAKWEAKKVKDPAALPDNKKLAEIYNKLGEVYARQFEPLRNAAGTGMPLDTTLFATTIDNIITTYTQSVVCDNTPDAKGKVKPRFQQQNFYYLINCKDYYNYAAMLNYQRGNIGEAAKYFNKYVDFLKNPVFTPAQRDSIYQANKKDYDQARFNVPVMYYQAKDWDGVLSVVDDALASGEGMHDLFLIKQAAYLAKGDTVQWLATLGEAVERDENNVGFMEQLVYYYTQKNDAKDALALAQKILSKDANNKNAWYMKGCVQLNVQKDFAASRESFERVLELDASHVDANINMGIAWMHELWDRIEAKKYPITASGKYVKAQMAQYQAEQKEIAEYYKKAQVYAEKARELAPNEPKRWGPSLSLIYSRLNMKAEADEVDALISAANN